jgi:hypothetical protein
MKQILRWTVLRINRRQALRGATTAAFGVLAGAAIGRPGYAVPPPPCTGPNGTGACLSQFCSTYRCRTYGLTQCEFVFGACPTPNGACWTSWNGGTCCDCVCTREDIHQVGLDSGGGHPVKSFYCYCFAP